MSLSLFWFCFVLSFVVCCVLLFVSFVHFNNSCIFNVDPQKKMMYDHVITSLLLILPYPWATVEPRYPGNSSLTDTPMPVIVVLDEPLDCKQVEVMTIYIGNYIGIIYIYLSIYMILYVCLCKSECRFYRSLGRLHQSKRRPNISATKVDVALNLITFNLKVLSQLIPGPGGFSNEKHLGQSPSQASLD